MRLLALLASLALAAPVSAAGTVERGLSVDSKVLGRPIQYTLYRSDKAPVDGKYAILYLLHGVGGDENSWFDDGKIAGLLDAGIRSGWLPPLIAAAPRGGISWYVDNPDAGGEGRMFTALRDDFIPAIEAGQIEAGRKVAGCRGGRAIGGISMGGYGALLQAFGRPGDYAAVFSLSGGLFRERASPAERDEALVLPFRENWFRGAFGTPLDPGRFDEWTVFRRLPGLLTAPMRPHVWLSAGTDDFPAPIDGSVRLHLMLGREDHPSTLRISAGRHDWEHWTSVMPEVLAWLGERLDPTCRGN